MSDVCPNTGYIGLHQWRDLPEPDEREQGQICGRCRAFDKDPETAASDTPETPR